jgi:prolyl-tRNA synthetase
MKDAYSFHADDESLDREYWNMYAAYERIFKRCGLNYVIVNAETGEMGGSGSHQFTAPSENGEDVIVYTEDNSYAANIEKAAVDPLPSIERQATSDEPLNVHTPNVGSIEAVCEFLKTKPAEMIKTIIMRTPPFNETSDKMRSAELAKRDGRISFGLEAFRVEKVVALVRGDHELNPEKLTQLLGVKSELANEAMIEKITGAKVGFAGPIGLAEKVDKLIIDHAVAAMAVGISGANKTDYHTKNVVPGRDFLLQGDNIIVADVRNAVEGDTYNGKKLLFKRGIEVGQVFKLGRKYTSKLNCKFLDETGKEQICTMGCYGIGINRIVASAIEAGNDENGIIFPVSIAPFEVIVTSVNQDDEQIASVAEEIYEGLKIAGIDVLFDDRDLRGGIKFKDADLLGIPVRITVGKKSVADGNVEIKLRSQSEKTTVSINEAVEKAVELVNKLKEKIEP